MRQRDSPRPLPPPAAAAAAAAAAAGYNAVAARPWAASISCHPVPPTLLGWADGRAPAAPACPASHFATQSTSHPRRLACTGQPSAQTEAPAGAVPRHRGLPHAACTVGGAGVAAAPAAAAHAPGRWTSGGRHVAISCCKLSPLIHIASRYPVCTASARVPPFRSRDRSPRASADWTNWQPTSGADYCRVGEDPGEPDWPAAAGSRLCGAAGPAPAW